MTEQIIIQIITYLVPLILGYLLKSFTNYFKKGKLEQKALMNLLQNNLTNTYFVYEKIGEIPDYVYKNWLNQLVIYEKLGGDDYIHEIAIRMKELRIIKTNIIKDHNDK